MANKQQRAGSRLRVRRGAGGLAGLAVATVLAWIVVLVAPSRTTVQVEITGQGAVGRVNDAALELAIPPAPQTAPGQAGWIIAAPAASLYYLPADPTTPLVALGRLGEAIQDARPAAHWEFAAPAGSSQGPVAWRPLPGGADGATAASTADPAYATPPGTRLAATLIAGRVPAGIMIHLNAAGDGYAFVLRPERRTVAWWQVQGGALTTELASGIYRPAFWAGMAELAQEAALALTGALALALVTLGLAALAGWAGRRAAPATPPARRSGPARPSARRAYQWALLPLLAFGLAGTLATLAVGLGPLAGIPHVQDDAAYLWQARVFALGHAWVPAPPGPAFFDHGFVIITDGRWFAKYPPGWPLMLAIGVLLGLPWLINPLCAGITLALAYAIGRRLYGPVAGFWAATLGLLSPFFLFMSGSYMAHPVTLLAVTVALYCFVRLMASGSPWRVAEPTILSLGAGFALGWAFISREATAVGVAVPFVAWGLVAIGQVGVNLARGRGGQAGRVRDAFAPLVPFILLALGGVIPLLGLGLVNQAQLGSPFHLAQELVGSYDRLGFGPGFGPEDGGHSPALGLYNGLVYLRTLEGVLFGWPLPLTFAPLVIALFGLLRSRWTQARWDLFLLGGFLGLVGIYFAWWSATTIFGPRYWYEGSAFLWLLSGRGIQWLGGGTAALARRLGSRARPARALALGAPALVIGLLVVFNLGQVLPGQVRAYTAYNGIDDSSLRRVAAAHLDQALVFVALQPAYPRRDYGKVFFANDPLLRGPVVYVRDLGPAKNRTLLPAFPGRAPYYLPLDGPPRPGVGPSRLLSAE